MEYTGFCEPLYVWQEGLRTVEVNVGSRIITDVLVLMIKHKKVTNEKFHLEWQTHTEHTDFEEHVKYI